MEIEKANRLDVRVKAALCALFLIAACGLSWAEQGTARIKGMSVGSRVDGTVKFEDTDKGLKVTAELSGVPPGVHGIHIHEFSSCGDQGKAAGDHYNPLNHPHGDTVAIERGGAHAGDLGNVVADKDGKASLQIVIPGIKLSEGKLTVAWRAVILHEKRDDFGQPAGNAGGRIGCGEIVIIGK